MWLQKQKIIFFLWIAIFDISFINGRFVSERNEREEISGQFEDFVHYQPQQVHLSVNGKGNKT